MNPLALVHACRLRSLLLLAWCGIGLGPGPAPLRAAPTPAVRPPNILVCIADDWSWPHAGAYGDPVVRTPHFDRIAREGALFTHAFCASPSCTPSRAALLTGRMPHRLAEGANLWGFLPRQFAVYPDLLEQAGYVVGHQGKGWGPGNFKAGGRDRNPAGPPAKSFEEFLKSLPDGRPFCFWFGSTDPHRPYVQGAGAAAGLRAEAVLVPPWLPDTPEVRRDILDYYFEVERFDLDVGRLLKLLADAGKLDDTLVVVTSDNGMPFPRAKTNLHDSGTRLPLAVRWPSGVRPGRPVDALVQHMDLTATFLEAAGASAPAGLDGRSLLALLAGRGDGKARAEVFLERERHANVRAGDLGYPVRAVRTRGHLYVRNLQPARWPSGDPEMWKAVGPYGDCDASPSKDWILQRREQAATKFHYDLAFARRSAEELYDLRSDPHQVTNLVERPAQAAVLKQLRERLDAWMSATQDPRATNGGAIFEQAPYFGDGRPRSGLHRR